MRLINGDELKQEVAVAGQLMASAWTFTGPDEATEEKLAAIVRRATG